jgi:hypothetical protein
LAKKNAFEDLLNAEFRWPRNGDRPFVVAPDGLDNAVVTVESQQRLVLMMEGYREAGDIMVRASERDRHLRDMLVFPIIFNYRQFLELSLKYQLSTHGHSVGTQPNWQTHDLDTLWISFVDMLGKYGTSDPDEADPILGEIVAEFAKIDPQSYSYRYPVDKRGRPIPVAYADLHLPSLADVMEAVANYFTGTDGYLTNRNTGRA